MAYTTIDNPGLFFNTVLYTGANKSITGVNFQPDWVWIKERDSGYHAIFDSIRGATKILSSNVTNAESTQSDTLTSFDSDGFTLGADSSNYVGGSSTSTVSWNWLAGTSFSNDASATGIGTIDSSGSVSDAAGFSIVSYTGNSTSGASIKHGLSSAVKFVVGKAINTSGEDWYTGHASNGFDKYIKLNDTHAAQTFSGVFNDTAPNTSIVTLGSNGIINSSSYNYIMYSQKKKATQNLEATQVMEMLMEHLFIQDLNQLGLWLKEQWSNSLGKYKIQKEMVLMIKIKEFLQM
jgi:hypothetical protein